MAGGLTLARKEMTNQLDTVMTTSTTIPMILGPLLTSILAIVVVVMLAIFVVGLFAWHHKESPWVYGWWLRGLSFWTALLAVLCYGSFWVKALESLGHATMSNPEVWIEWQIEAYWRLSAPMGVALIGWTLGLCLGLSRKRPPTTA